MIKGLLIKWLDKKDFLDGKDKNTLFEIGCKYSNDVGVLYNINRAVIRRQEETFLDSDNKIALRVGNGRN